MRAIHKQCKTYFVSSSVSRVCSKAATLQTRISDSVHICFLGTHLAACRRHFVESCWACRPDAGTRSGDRTIGQVFGCPLAPHRISTAPARRCRIRCPILPMRSWAHRRHADPMALAGHCPRKFWGNRPRQRACGAAIHPTCTPPTLEGKAAGHNNAHGQGDRKGRPPRSRDTMSNKRSVQFCAPAQDPPSRKREQAKQ